MKAYAVIADKVRKIGISNAELARRSSINPELLRRSLAGERELKADELISLSVQLGLTVDDFIDVKKAG